MLRWLHGLMYVSSACADSLAHARLQIRQIVLSTFWLLQAGTLSRDAKQYVAFHARLHCLATAWPQHGLHVCCRPALAQYPLEVSCGLGSQFTPHGFECLFSGTLLPFVAQKSPARL